LTLRLAAAGPGRFKRVPLGLELNGETLPGVTVWSGRGFREHDVRISREIATRCRNRPLTLTLTCDTWSPGELGISADARDLGVMVDWVLLRDARGRRTFAMVDIGRDDDGAIGGFHRPEEDPAGPMVSRYVRPFASPAEIVAPWFGGKEVVLRLRAAARDPRTSQGIMRVSVEGRPLGEDMALGPELRDYEIRVPADFPGDGERDRVTVGIELSGELAERGAVLDRIAVEAR
jgi:hypothetical protein